MNKHLFTDWLTLGLNSVITLSHDQILEYSKTNFGKIAPVDFQVKRITRFKEFANNCNYVLFELHDSQSSFLFAVRQVNGSEKLDFRLYFNIPELSGTRMQLINQNVLLSEGPALGGFPASVNDAKYTSLIQGNDMNFAQKNFGELNGNVTESQIGTVLPTLLGTIVEYSAVAEHPTPEILVYEAGKKDGNNSYISTYQGCELNPFDFEVLGV